MHRIIPAELPVAVPSVNLLEASSLFREYLIFFPWFLNHGVFGKFIQLKSCVKSVSLLLFSWFHRQLTEERDHGNMSNGNVIQSGLYVLLLQS